MCFLLTSSEIEIGLFIFLGSAVVGIIYLLVNLVTEVGSIINRRNWVSNVPITVLTREVIKFTNDILYQKSIKYFPHCKVSYYRHKKHMGVFKVPGMVIYCRNHNNIPDLVNTILHEICHFIQYQTDTREFNKYDMYLRTHGYDKNPIEVESRQFADDWLDPCLKYLKSRNIIKKI